MLSALSKSHACPFVTFYGMQHPKLLKALPVPFPIRRGNWKEKSQRYAPPAQVLTMNRLISRSLGMVRKLQIKHMGTVSPVMCRGNWREAGSRDGGGWHRFRVKLRQRTARAEHAHGNITT